MGRKRFMLCHLRCCLFQVELAKRQASYVHAIFVASWGYVHAKRGSDLLFRRITMPTTGVFVFHSRRTSWTLNGGLLVTVPVVHYQRRNTYAHRIMQLYFIISVIFYQFLSHRIFFHPGRQSTSKYIISYLFCADYQSDYKHLSLFDKNALSLKTNGFHSFS